MKCGFFYKLWSIYTDIVWKVSRRLRRWIGKQAWFNKDVSIVANNCIGADIARTYGLRYNSPTINLQILPWDFPKFTSNIESYLEKDIVPLNLTDLSAEEESRIMKFYGNRTIQELGFPFGLCGDIVIAFQHYKNFDEAKKKWDERKQRFHMDNAGFVLVLTEKDIQYAKEFDKLKFGGGKRKLSLQ